ncbi:hypothetical protein WJX72_006973 [[Myrmecia] bisecta]|uniref:Uncharacterized protein n=1 Tax=[Myrmecia] bisecta TaxID=41462 RepID=A0AAW1PD57_9CHLO
MAPSPSKLALKLQQAQSVCGPDNKFSVHLGKPYFYNTKSEPARKSIHCAIEYSQLMGRSFVVRHEGFVVGDQVKSNAYGSFKTANHFVVAAALDATKPNQNLYEVIPTMWARFFSQDLDWKLAENPDKEKVVKCHVDFTYAFVRQVYGIELEARVEISDATGWFEDKGYEKASFHIKYYFWHR